jgi:hypothetical protein
LAIPNTLVQSAALFTAAATNERGGAVFFRFQSEPSLILDLQTQEAIERYLEEATGERYTDSSARFKPAEKFSQGTPILENPDNPLCCPLPPLTGHPLPLRFGGEGTASSCASFVSSTLDCTQNNDKLAQPWCCVAFSPKKGRLPHLFC